MGMLPETTASPEFAQEAMTSDSVAPLQQPPAVLDYLPSKCKFLNVGELCEMKMHLL